VQASTRKQKRGGVSKRNYQGGVIYTGGEHKKNEKNTGGGGNVGFNLGNECGHYKGEVLLTHRSKSQAKRETEEPCFISPSPHREDI